MTPSQRQQANLGSSLYILLKEEMVVILMAYKLVRNIKWDMSETTQHSALMTWERFDKLLSATLQNIINGLQLREILPLLAILICSHCKLGLENPNHQQLNSLQVTPIGIKTSKIEQGVHLSYLKCLPEMHGARDSLSSTVKRIVREMKRLERK